MKNKPKISKKTTTKLDRILKQAKRLYDLQHHEKTLAKLDEATQIEPNCLEAFLCRSSTLIALERNCYKPTLTSIKISPPNLNPSKS